MPDITGTIACPGAGSVASIAARAWFNGIACPGAGSVASIAARAWFTAGDDAEALRVEYAGVEIEPLVAAGAVPGVAVLHAAGRNGTGTGYLRVNAAGDAIQWKAPGSASYGAEVAVPSDGIYLLRDSNLQKWVRVQVWTAELIAAEEAEVELRDAFDNAIGGEDVTAAEAEAGDVSAWTLTLRNVSAETVSGVRAWLDASTAGIEISDDGVAWVSPTTEAGSLSLGNLAAGATMPLYVRRTIAAETASDGEILNQLRVRSNTPA